MVPLAGNGSNGIHLQIVPVPASIRASLKEDKPRVRAEDRIYGSGRKRNAIRVAVEEFRASEHNIRLARHKVEMPGEKMSRRSIRIDDIGRQVRSQAGKDQPVAIRTYKRAP